MLCPGWVRTRILESERNRPEAPREPTGPANPLMEQIRELMAKAIEGGIEPRKVGEIVVDAIRTRRFYVLTHDWQDMVEHYVHLVIEGKDPIGMPPPGTGLADARLTEILGGQGGGDA